MPFADLGLSPEVLRAVEEVGYVEPTPIQAQAIPYVLMGRDVLGSAQTGTGKTASFTLPMIDILTSGRGRVRMPRSLILEPTRELATQVAENFDVYGKYHKLTQALLIGGESFAEQLKKLDRGVDVLIATPGRLLDLFERGKILLSDVKILVIDEADRMLDMGFIPDVERIVGLLPKIRQTLFFSATMPPEIRRLADAFLMNPKEIAVAPPASPAATVVQGLAVVEPDAKRETLRRLIKSEDVKNAIIFCNRKRDVDILYRSLTKHGCTSRRCTASYRNPSSPRRSSASATARSACWSPATSPPAASIFRACRTCSISTCRSTPRITSTVSAVPAAPAVKAAPSLWQRPKTAASSRRSNSSSASRSRRLRLTASPPQRCRSKKAIAAAAAARAGAAARAAPTSRTVMPITVHRARTSTVTKRRTPRSPISLRLSPSRHASQSQRGTRQSLWAPHLRQSPPRLSPATIAAIMTTAR